jgi:hypothetical protein
VPVLDVLETLQRGYFRLGDRLAGLRNDLREICNFSGSTLLAYASIGIMAAIFVNDLLAPLPAASSVTPAPPARPLWSEVPRAQGFFALATTALDASEARYVVRRHRDGGRKDDLIWGSATGHGPYVRVTLYRPGHEGEAPADPLDAVADIASEAGIDAELTGPVGSLNTKFGPLSAVDMVVESGEGGRSCVAVAGAWSDPRFGLVAWWCNPGPELVARGQLACLLDRLALMSAGGDDRLAKHFAQAELHRGYCGTERALRSPTPKRADHWLDARSAPKLRGRIVGR